MTFAHHQSKWNKLVLGALAIACMGLFASCGSEPKKVEIPITSNPNDEFQSFENDLATAQHDQADVMSPKNFKNASENYENAKELKQKNKSAEKTFASLGLARAYLNQAKETTAKVQSLAPNVTSARAQALEAGANKNLPKDLASIDNDLKDSARSIENGGEKFSEESRSKLQQRYLDLELKSLKVTYISPLQNQIEAAKKDGAAKLSPKTLSVAVDKVKNAQTVIETDRHDKDAIAAAVGQATQATQQLLTITHAAANDKKKTPEELALEMQAKGNTINAMGGALAEQSQVNNALVKDNSQLANANDKLTKEGRINRAYKQAQQEFSPAEAEVYIQGGQLLIRLKTMNFKSGQASLPEDAVPVLTKVKDVIQNVGAEKVEVQGHTDSVGGKLANEKLSQSRADTVATYLKSEKVVAGNDVEAKGFGFEKPLASNKTKEGRAQNRRVDVIITPTDVQ